MLLIVVLAMKRKLIAVLVAALVVCCLAWNQTRREQLVLQAWCQENGLHIKAVHWSWRWEGGRFHQDWTGHSPLPRDWKGNIYRFEAVRDGETATQVYWAIITLWRGQMEVAVETPAHSYVRVGTSQFPRAVF
jgi:hypothetical protein